MKENKTYNPIVVFIKMQTFEEVIDLVLNVYRGVQTWSWRAGVLQSLAPTSSKTPAWKFLASLVRS